MLYVFWFRKDLRLTDNRGLFEFAKAVSGNNNFLFLYIKNKNTYNYFGEKRISFLLECLADLKEELNSFGFELQIFEGKSTDVFKKIIDKYKTVKVFCNLQVEPYCIKRDKNVKELIEDNDGSFSSFTDTTIFKSGEIKNSSGEQFRVFTPFRKQALSVLTGSDYKKYDAGLSELKKDNEVILEVITHYKLESGYGKLQRSDFIRGGRKEGLKLFKDFYENSLDQYKTKRDFPSVKGTSILSSHLHFGTIGIREVFRTALTRLNKVKTESKKISVETWIKELLWREFYYNITYNNPRLMHESFRSEFDNLRWNYDETVFIKWCEGKTGFPIVDAGMRQLNKEGWMHNRVRMIVAMFLTKDLFMDWRFGENYFAKELIDLDFSSNNGGWQWSASTGVDAQPYFRIFNPYLQSRKFDVNGEYIKKYVPELSSLPPALIHEPNLMSTMEQEMYNVTIGKDYPEPIVEHSKAKDEAIKRFKELSGKN